MTIRLIAEGHTKQDRKSLNWGLSFLIGDSILFDAFGREDIFIRNIRKFKINIKRLRHIVISHDDWDHVSGINWVLSRNKNITVCACRDSTHEFFDSISGAVTNKIFRPRLVDKGVYSTGCLRADLSRGVIFEQALIISGSNGQWLLCGCSHPGIDALVDSAMRISGAPIKGVIGGFHMKDNTLRENAKIIGKLRKLGVCSVVPLHCTGQAACRLLRLSYGKSCLKMVSGDILDI